MFMSVLYVGESMLADDATFTAAAVRFNHSPTPRCCAKTWKDGEDGHKSVLSFISSFDLKLNFIPGCVSPFASSDKPGLALHVINLLGFLRNGVFRVRPAVGLISMSVFGDK